MRFRDATVIACPQLHADKQRLEPNHLPGRIALVQFSRGCPLSCSYCGQWKFWKKWRHRSIEEFVDDLEFLDKQCGVSMAWTADENWGEDPALLHRLLTAITARGLKLRLFCAMCAKDVVRDREVLHLYKNAGIACLMMGFEPEIHLSADGIDGADRGVETRAPDAGGYISLRVHGMADPTSW